MFGNGSRILGIDIGEKSVKIAQVKGTSGKRQISAWSLLDRDRPNLEGHRWRAEMFEDIKLSMSVNGVKAAKASICLPDSLVTISYRKLPPMPKEELANALMWEAGKDWKFPVEEMTLDFITLGEVFDGSDKMNAYLVAVSRKNLVTDLVNRLSGLKIKVRSVEVSTMAQMTCLLSLADVSGIVSMVDIGEQFTNLLILKNGQVRFFRTINMGGAFITDTISKSTGLNWWEADELKKTGIQDHRSGDEELSRSLRGGLESIVDEVFQTFHFYGAERREGSVERVVITGGGGLMPGVNDFMQEILGIPAQVMDPFRTCVPSGNLRDRDKLISRGSRMVTALGLAMAK